MRYLELLDQLEALVREARSVPLSSSVVIPRDETLSLIAALREALPKETEQAKEVLAAREDVLAQAEAEAQRIIEQAKAERARLVSKTEIMQTATQEARRVVEEAEAAAGKLRLQADDYVDAKLANFEILLTKTLRTVARGREQLRRRIEAAQGEVPPLSLEDSGEISSELPVQP